MDNAVYTASQYSGHRPGKNDFCIPLLRLDSAAVAHCVMVYSMLVTLEFFPGVEHHPDIHILQIVQLYLYSILHFGKSVYIKQF